MSILMVGKSGPHLGDTESIIILRIRWNDIKLRLPKVPIPRPSGHKTNALPQGVELTMPAQHEDINKYSTYISYSCL